jgi:hypothetical protein
VTTKKRKEVTKENLGAQKIMNKQAKRGFLNI